MANNLITNIKNFIIGFLPPHLMNIYRKIKKTFLQPFKKDEVIKLFDGEELLFMDLLDDCSVYGEYGCGESTIYAANNTDKEIISIDNSIEWINKVKGRISQERIIDLHHSDMGDLLPWGFPRTYDYKENFKDYFEYMWMKDKTPDFVLIDGRFRVACFLTTLLYAEKDTLVLFDDYVDRGIYKIVEKFIKPIQINGRQAVFRIQKSFQEDELKDYISRFELVFD
tara:strand:- start:178 stop:852 length:675 start_codon:yes stop_codon:yes gene_type:complete